MILAVDIGNTDIVFGGVEGKTIVFEARLRTEVTKTSDEYGIDLKNLLEINGISAGSVEGAIICSVVPQVLNPVRLAVQKLTGKTGLVVGPGLKTGLNIHLENPGQMGGDLVAADVAALREHKPPLIVVDMSTATSVSVLDKTGAHIGGCICPGVRLSQEALTRHTSLLPGLQLDKPKRVIGRNTTDAMRSGVLVGAACMLDGLVERIEEELGSSAAVIVTGEIGRYIVPLCRKPMIYDRVLLLKGLAALYRENQRLILNSN